MKLFRSKKQEAEIKELPILKATRRKTIDMSISLLEIKWSVSQRTPYTANIFYAERPTDWGNQGVTESIEISAESWPTLLDKVAKHFEEREVQL